MCRYLFCLQWLEIYCFKYQVFNRSAPLQRYYYLECFIELVSVQRHFCCPAHFYSETSLGRELTSNFCLPLKFAHNPTLLSDRARQFIATTTADYYNYPLLVRRYLKVFEMMRPCQSKLSTKTLHEFDLSFKPI